MIGDGAEILPYAVLGKKCVIGKNSVVSKSVLWDRTQVGNGIRLEEVVLGRHCRVSDHSRLGPGSVLGDEAYL